MTQSPSFGAVPTGSGLQVRNDFNVSHQCEATEHAGTSPPSLTYQFMKWRNPSTGALYRRNAANSGWEIIEWFATSNPTTNDDAADGFTIRSLWCNTTGASVFVCTDASTGAAVWSQVGQAAGGSVSSVFGRGGAVLAQSGDYTAAQITETTAAKVMTAAERTKLDGINSYWTNRLTIDPAASVKNVSLGAHDLRSFTIYYGIPNSANGANNTDHAAALFARFDDVVLGYDLQNPANSNYATTVAIIAKAKALNPRLVIWGNIDVGVSGGTSHNHSTGTLQTHIDQWVTAGANGIFCDNFGYDRAVTRARQNTIIAYVHGKGIGSMLYSTAIADALAPLVVTTYNASGTATVADSRDAYAFIFGMDSNSIIAPYFTTFSAMKTRGDDARSYRTSLGVRMFGINVIQHTGTSATTLDNYRGMSEGLGHIFRLDGVGLAQHLFSASGTDINRISPYYQRIPQLAGGRLIAPYRVNGASVELEAVDLGVIVHWESGQYSWTAPGQTIVSSGGGGTPSGGDSGLLPTAVQTANGTAPNAERVIIKGTVSEVYLLIVSSSRHSCVFINRTIQTVLFTSSETITGYPTGYGLPAGEAVNFIRDPDNNQWFPVSA